MKQVARKSTTSVPQKLSAGNQPNGLIRESSGAKISANVASSVLSASSEIELTNGIHNSCEQVLRNDVVPSNHSRAITAADTSRQQTVQHSVCTITSASNLPVSAASAPLPTVSRASANIENSKNLKDVPVPVKHASAVTTKPSLRAASVAASVNSPNDVIIVNSGVAVAGKPDVDSVKRSVSPGEQLKSDIKKARIDGAVGQSVMVEGSSRLTRKEIDSWLLDFCNQYTKSKYESDMALMAKKV